MVLFLKPTTLIAYNSNKKNPFHKIFVLLQKVIEFVKILQVNPFEPLMKKYNSMVYILKIPQISIYNSILPSSRCIFTRSKSNFSLAHGSKIRLENSFQGHLWLKGSRRKMSVSNSENRHFWPHFAKAKIWLEATIAILKRIF